MGLISFLVIGLVAGWLAGQIMKGKGFGLVGNIIIGVLGAVLGGLLFGLLGLSATGTIGSLVTATVGAVVLFCRRRTSEEGLAQEKNPFKILERDLRVFQLDERAACFRVVGFDAEQSPSAESKNVPVSSWTRSRVAAPSGPTCSRMPAQSSPSMARSVSTEPPADTLDELAARA